MSTAISTKFIIRIKNDMQPPIQIGLGIPPASSLYKYPCIQLKTPIQVVLGWEHPAIFIELINHLSWVQTPSINILFILIVAQPVEQWNKNCFQTPKRLNLLGVLQLTYPKHSMFRVGYTLLV
jgi:hypothetical protein